MNSSLSGPGVLNRREAIKKTLIFSTALMAAGWTRRLGAQAPAADFPAEGIHLLAFGDFGSNNANQQAVATQMAAFAKKLNAPLSGVLALGDNFYRWLNPDRFDWGFEAMYPARDFPCPFYALLGNHDYGPKYDSGQGRPKAQLQLDYAQNHPASRWKMPAKWYAFELPDPAHPLVKIIYLDSNFFEGALTPQEKLAQQRFLDAELKKPSQAPWLWIAGHHPLFSDGAHGDDLDLAKRFGPALLESPASLYLCGHDHTLQHLEIPEYKASFVVTGGGGADLYKITHPGRGYAEQVLGFTHLHVTSAAVDVQHIDTEGRCLHSFRRTPDGQMKVTTPV